MTQLPKGPLPANDNATGDTARDEAAASGKCPICGKPRAARYRPFCSRRCADIDLGRWLDGSYAVPVAEEEVSEADLAAIARGDQTDKRGDT